MKSVIRKKEKIFYRNSIGNNYLNLKIKKKLLNNFLGTSKKIFKNIDKDHNTFHILSKRFKLNFDLKKLNKFKKYKTVVVIGMGGSILGAEAIYNLLEKKIKKKFIFFNNIDKDKIEKFKKNYNLKKSLFILISKSGNTLETLVNLSSLNITKNNNKNIIILTEKNNNYLNSLSKKKNILCIEHRKYIGGRYSVLTETGLVPAYLMGINIFELRKDIKKNFELKNKNFLKQSSTILANLFINKKINSIVLVNYIPELNSFLCWFQQLIAESLGKKYKGFLPLISECPRDHHSLLQLYLDGPKDKLFYIFSDCSKKEKKISGSNFDFLNNKGFNEIKTAQKDALLETFDEKKVPYREFKISNFTEKKIGELFSYFILEVAITGLISNINPFDQPAVELIKIKTKKKLLKI